MPMPTKKFRCYQCGEFSDDILEIVYCRTGQTVFMCGKCYTAEIFRDAKELDKGL